MPDKSAYAPLNRFGLLVKSEYEPVVATVAKVGIPERLEYAPSKFVEIVPEVTLKPEPTITPPRIEVVASGKEYAAGRVAQATPVPVDFRY